MDKEIYRKHCQTEEGLSIFSTDWWLDATCGKENWDVVVVEKDKKIVASLPYKKGKKHWFNIISQPKLTQKLGPSIKYPDKQKYEKKISYEKKILTELFTLLPKNDIFVQNFDYSITNWLPLYWLGYKQTTNYTYVIEDLSDHDIIWQGLNNKTRTDIRKAEMKVSVDSSDDIEEFYNINLLTFRRQGIQMPYNLDFLRKVDKACVNRKCRKIFVARDDDGRIHAAIYLVWDKNSAYYLMGGGDPKLRNSGAMHLLIWEAIKFSSTITKTFDFEGSMIESVEKFVRSFGAKQKPYSSITKVNSRILMFRNFITSL